MLWKKKHKDVTEEDLMNNEHVEKSQSKAKEYLQDTNKLKELIHQAEEKVGHSKGKESFLKENIQSLKTMFELVKTYIKGDYKHIPYRSLLFIVGAIVYFVSPIDTIPDILVGFGFTDDAAVIGFTLMQVKKDLDNFKAWKDAKEIDPIDE
ncbi:YkvA family protein [Pontibacillus litoralis]|uniref:DUF1232 domain-containing protein n=1 Tax=Pontibacillus litoralis JSM 072002 TaxID=1385512 RepID=A0A0A5G795_9BACI|nr:YkvA family protein [Pontibacillus litoralis]KGX87018.1 hypothetical protein N784_02535 [Pontibacillus litoralis JSM 072002]